MKYIMFCLIGLLFLQTANAQLKSKSVIIGSVYRNINELPAFKDYKEQEGHVIGPGNVFGLSMITRRRYTIILLEKFISDNAIVKYKILDFAVIGNVERTQSLIISYCLLNKHRNNRIFALVKNNGKGDYNNVLKAWEINLSTQKIESISIKGISCIDEDYTDTD